MSETDTDININCSICTDDLEIKPKKWCVKNNKDILNKYIKDSLKNEIN